MNDLAQPEQRITQDEAKQALADIGELGFGRDASIGLGRFTVEELAPTDWPARLDADAWVTLAPCVP